MPLSVHARQQEKQEDHEKRPVALTIPRIGRERTYGSFSQTAEVETFGGEDAILILTREDRKDPQFQLLLTFHESNLPREQSSRVDPIADFNRVDKKACHSQ